jgi:hypothetical protein
MRSRMYLPPDPLLREEGVIGATSQRSGADPDLRARESEFVTDA